MDFGGTAIHNTLGVFQKPPQEIQTNRHTWVIVTKPVSIHHLSTATPTLFFYLSLFLILFFSGVFSLCARMQYDSNVLIYELSVCYTSFPVSTTQGCNLL